MKDNLDLILKNPYRPFDPPTARRSSRRVISPGIGGKRRQFAGVIYGSDVLKKPEDGSSSSVTLGFPLPSMQQLAERERVAELQKEFLDGINRSKLPTPPSWHYPAPPPSRDGGR